MKVFFLLTSLQLIQLSLASYLRQPVPSFGMEQKADSDNADATARSGEYDESQQDSMENIFERSSNSSRSNAEPRIVGGTEAKEKEYPFYVHGTTTQICGASLIHPDIVLTAAHCQTVFTKDVIIGSNKIAGQKFVKRIAIDKVLPHPEYYQNDTTWYNDIMLIKLKFSATAPLMKLNTDPNLPKENQVVRIVGFGQTSEDGTLSNDLLEVELNTVG